jgi:FkbH-like protein
MINLHWLPECPDWTSAFRAMEGLPAEKAWPALVQVSRHNTDFVRTERLARAIGRLCGEAPPASLASPPVRLAILSSCTVGHLAPGIKAAGLRRNLWIDVHVGNFGQYQQELSDPNSEVRAFSPNAVLFALDARHLIGSKPATWNKAEIDAALTRTLDRLAHCWALARDLGAVVLQQTAFSVLPSLVGGNERRLPWSPRRLLDDFNERLGERADACGVDLLDIGGASHRLGADFWHDPVLWHNGKQEIHPRAAPLYGEHVVRLIAARRGRSSKCLVLDLDNTLWGGVIGDDGLEGIVLGQGSARGEAHVALQAYARDLSRRGVILAVCSKNDEANAIEPFERHQEMVLRKEDIACFVANWQDKATNLRSIAQRLNIGLDSLVFVDDNPFERNLVRRELPMVEVPELPEDPAGYVPCLSAAGYFEAVAFTAEDAERAAQYRENARREEALSNATDIDAYLRSLDMEMPWRPFDPVGMPRVVQLINKSNQFNLTTRRYTPAEAEAVAADPEAITLQLRLIDAYGDNGMIAVVIGRALQGEEPRAMEIDTWLMSCRVLGRGVEQATMNLLAQLAAERGVETLYGRYLKTSKNGMVADHYVKLGFEKVSGDSGDETLWRLDLRAFAPYQTHIRTVRS